LDFGTDARVKRFKRKERPTTIKKQCTRTSSILTVKDTEKQKARHQQTPTIQHRGRQGHVCESHPGDLAANGCRESMVRAHAAAGVGRESDSSLLAWPHAPPPTPPQSQAQPQRGPYEPKTHSHRDIGCGGGGGVVMYSILLLSFCVGQQGHAQMNIRTRTHARARK
jgi:hypothetical protein